MANCCGSIFKMQVQTQSYKKGRRWPKDVLVPKQHSLVSHSGPFTISKQCVCLPGKCSFPISSTPVWCVSLHSFWENLSHTSLAECGAIASTYNLNLESLVRSGSCPKSQQEWDYTDFTLSALSVKIAYYLWLWVCLVHTISAL